jgi:hypothetical protein
MYYFYHFYVFCYIFLVLHLIQNLVVGRIKRYGRTFEAANPAELTQDTDSQPTKDQSSGPSTMNGGTS